MRRWDCKDIDRDVIVQELLLEAGLTDAPMLADSLAALGSLASMPAPAPGPALAAMLAGDARALPADELGKRRKARKHRPVVIGAAVLTAMGLGVGGVAASTAGFSKGTPAFMQALFSDWAPSWTTAPPSLVPPAPNRDTPKVTTHPAPADPPPAFATAPSVPSPASVPSPPKTVVPPAVGDAAGDAAAPSDDAAAVKDPSTEALLGRPELPKPVHTESKADSPSLPKQTTDTLPKVGGSDLSDGLKQIVQGSKDSVVATSPGASVRWLLGLAR